MKYLFFILVSKVVLGWNEGECSKLKNTGFFGPYKYWGVGSKSALSMSSKEGSTKHTAGFSSESPTVSVDPYWTFNNHTLFWTQYSSSWGGCAMLGLEMRKEAIEQYIAAHEVEVFKELSQGEGEHLVVLAHFSGCSVGSLENFKHSLQENFGNLRKVLNQPKQFVQGLDKILVENQHLKNSCAVTQYL